MVSVHFLPQTRWRTVRRSATVSRARIDDDRLTWRTTNRRDRASRRAWRRWHFDIGLRWYITISLRRLEWHFTSGCFCLFKFRTRLRWHYLVGPWSLWRPVVWSRRTGLGLCIGVRIIGESRCRFDHQSNFAITNAATSFWTISLRRPLW